MFLDHLRPAVALVTLCLIFVQGRAHQAQQLPSAPPVAQASHARTAPVLDGRVLDDPAWQDVPALVEFWQTAPDAGQPSSERTEVRIVYTESAIYLAWSLLDRDPSGLTTSDSRRDSPLDDTVGARVRRPVEWRGHQQSVRWWGRRQQANIGVFIVYTDSHLLDESPFRPSNADHSFIVKISRMFDALR